MSGDVYFQRDVERVLESVIFSGQEIANASRDASYARGYLAAVQAVALVFGIRLQALPIAPMPPMIEQR